MLPIPFRTETEAWAPGRDPWSRILLLLILLPILLAYLGNPLHSSIFDGLNLVVHEAGHMFFFWFGEFLGMAGGTIFELAIPLAVGVLFFRQRDYFALPVILFWLGTALVHVGVYMADARTQTLNLVAMGYGEPMHDWYYLLARTGLLRQDRLLGGGTRLLGLGAMALGMIWGAWIVRAILEGEGRKSEKRPRTKGPEPPFSK